MRSSSILLMPSVTLLQGNTYPSLPSWPFAQDHTRKR
ncbi:hypothetical protein GQ600_4269 [Phytophthora cactorum]|nr:hypothetical protein GQ600_4269 [Phytophthora cactorum]